MSYFQQYREKIITETSHLPLLEQPVEVLPLRTVVCHSLKRVGVDTVGKTVEFVKAYFHTPGSPYGMGKPRNFGKKSQDELIQVLQERGLLK